MSIDCGLTPESWDNNDFHYEADGSPFVESGKVYSVSSEHTLTSDEEQSWQQLNTLRSFPEGQRNCYTLAPKQGRGNKYLIRAFFKYGNYDKNNSIPTFDLHLGVNYWTTIYLSDSSDVVRSEVIHVAQSDHIDVCLINKGQGTPFISSLELWPLPIKLYQPTPNLLPLALTTRRNFGMTERFDFVRYPNDPYGRSWFQGDKDTKNSRPISTSIAIDDDSKEYKLPKEVLSTAITPLNSSFPLVVNVNASTNHEYYVYLHFFEFEKHSQNQQRSMDIAFTDSIRDNNVTLEYLQLQTIVHRIPRELSLTNISITSSPGSTLPPIVNDLEIYRVRHKQNSPTREGDGKFDAMRNIRHGYNIMRISWQGDPCMPEDYRWEGVTCNNYSGSIPRIISLNLSSSRLDGEIMGTIFSKLDMLESLDLSNNQLTGEIPESLAKVANLKVLNLTGNDLIGLVPESLEEKSGLTLSLDGNPGLCHTASSCKTKTLIGPLVASAIASAAVLLIAIFIPIMLCKRKRKPQNAMLPKKGGDFRSKCQAFSLEEVVSMTNNFESVIGEGGFGKVYLGKLQHGIQVAVKLLSKSSHQGFTEFESEAKLLSLVYHKNLVSLIGYCDDGDMKALIYEYMAKGNLLHLLTGKSPYVIKWKERLQIAFDAACGLNYLHNGCNPPIVHRDLKSSNILLSENMHAKIADFGLCKVFASDTDTHISTRPAGTFGYLDPEFHRCGNLHKNSDVYSFGIILLELMTGRPAIIKTSEGINHIVDWVTPKFKVGDMESIMDPKLEGKFNIASARKVIEIAMCCIETSAVKRPDINNVENDLKQCLALETNNESEESSSLFSSSTFDTSFYQCGSHSPPSVR
ncbi:probable LRR receptor-like serine/threonine-protein kinase At1g05700 isoform X3 [Prosopis cineraria]|nr:probable LRR receptor-like serine/threonine-protein kinase At1g05700 isoform X3 [Prosopis cineraria]XP_054782794.1 probable LRR receptor-like serine/threonine-protein kinase At1g05700 isoform X3 [Prosopis cineraria]